jgi:FkbM family methyltransferase
MQGPKMKLKSLDLLRNFTPGWLKSIAVTALTSDIIGAVVKKRAWVRSKRSLIFVDHPRISRSEAASIFFGIRERAEIDIINSLLPIKPETTVVELGSSIGVVSSVIAKHRPKRIICLEADLELLDLCRINVERNAPKHTELTFINQAISYTGEPCALFKTGTTSTSGRLHDITLDNEESADSHGHIASQSDYLHSVPASTLSDVLEREAVCNYILVSDIEGAEAYIWFSDPTALTLCQAIVVELESTITFTIDDQVSKLKSLGFFLQYQYGRVYLFIRD